VSDTTMTVEIADKVRIKLNRGNVAALANPSAQPQAPKDSKADSGK